MFAVVQTGGKQYKVSKGDILEVELLSGKDGGTVTLENVLMIGEGSKVTVGTPLVAGASVSAKVLEQKKADKIRVFKMKPKKRYERTQGHRQSLTVIEITDIKSSGAAKKATAKKTEAPKTEEKAEATPKKEEATKEA